MASHNNQPPKMPKMEPTSENQLVPYDYTKKALAPVPSKHLAPVPSKDLAEIPPLPSDHHSQSFYIHPTASFAERLRLRAAFLKVPEGTKLFDLMDGERLMGTKSDHHRNLRSMEYSTAPHFAIEGVRAEASKVKFIPPAEASQRMPSYPRNRKTVADLIKELEEVIETMREIQKTHSTIIKVSCKAHDRIDEMIERHKKRKEEKKAKKGKGPM